jgi:cell wall assembly regulator SMI1
MAQVRDVGLEIRGAVAEELTVTRLTATLVDLERAWLRGGMPHTDWLAPGLDPVEIELLLKSNAFDAPEEAVEWFAWHNGTTANTEQVRPLLGPSSLEPLSLEACFVERSRIAEVARQSEAEGAVLDEDEGSLWEDGWLPLARDVGGGLLTVDLADAKGGQVPVRRVDFWDVDMKKVQAQSLAEVVEFWIELLGSYCVWSRAKRGWDLDFVALPVDVRRRGYLI